MAWAALVLGLSLAAGRAAVAASYDSVADLLEFLNSPEGKHETHLQEARQDGQFTNRLNVVFEPKASPDQRSRVLREVGSKFLAVLFEHPGIPTVTVVEKDTAGTILNQAVTSLMGPPGTQPQPQQTNAAPMSAGD